MSNLLTSWAAVLKTFLSQDPVTHKLWKTPKSFCSCGLYLLILTIPEVKTNIFKQLDFHLSCVQSLQYHFSGNPLENWTWALLREWETKSLSMIMNIYLALQTHLGHHSSGAHFVDGLAVFILCCVNGLSVTRSVESLLKFCLGWLPTIHTPGPPYLPAGAHQSFSFLIYEHKVKNTSQQTHD